MLQAEAYPYKKPHVYHPLQIYLIWLQVKMLALLSFLLVLDLKKRTQ